MTLTKSAAAEELRVKGVVVFICGVAGEISLPMTGWQSKTNIAQKLTQRIYSSRRTRA